MMSLMKALRLTNSTDEHPGPESVAKELIADLRAQSVNQQIPNQSEPLPMNNKCRCANMYTCGSVASTEHVRRRAALHCTKPKIRQQNMYWNRYPR